MPVSLPSLRQGILLAFGLIIFWSCDLRVGPVAADGTCLNLSGDAVNAYAYPLPTTVEAALQVLAFLKVPVVSRQVAAGAAVIRATAPDGSPLRLQFVEEGRALTMVKIRTGAAGCWRNELSYYLHAMVDARLKDAGDGGIDTAMDRQAPLAAGEAGPGQPGEGVPLPMESHGTVSDLHENEAAKTGKAVPDDATPAEKEPESLLAAAPAPPPEPPPQPDARIYFEPDSNFPKDGEMAKLDRLARQLFDNPSWHLSLVGYAASDENEDRPQIVAENRVLAVKFYFIGRGIDSRRLIVNGYEVREGKAAPSVLDHHRVDLLLHRSP